MSPTPARKSARLLPLVMASAIATATPIALPLVPSPVLAQQRVEIEAKVRGDQPLYFNPGAIYELPLEITRPVTVGGVQLPRGSVIEGRLEPVEGGLRYVASHVRAGGFRRELQARSGILHDVKDPRETGTGAILTDAAIGAAGGVLLGVVFGNGVGLGEILGGAAAGVLVGNVTAQRVVILEPSKPITLRAQP